MMKGTFFGGTLFSLFSGGGKRKGGGQGSSGGGISSWFSYSNIYQMVSGFGWIAMYLYSIYTSYHIAKQTNNIVNLNNNIQS